jgi:hypothetical protein
MPIQPSVAQSYKQTSVLEEPTASIFRLKSIDTVAWSTIAMQRSREGTWVAW